ncbi:MAG: succinate dehydrogenase/fumarate reductase cytochrome b subunit [Fermentimonas sp.]|jgi:succinate dehydrogenase / fumarate reductase cytochrome b subunit
MGWLIDSSIGRKFVQSISGLFLILFLLVHASMNVVLIFSYDTYNFLASEVLGSNWWAVIGTIIIFFGFGVHIVYAVILTLQNKKARGNDRYEYKSGTETSWSSKNMFVLGVVLTIFLVAHLYQMWYEMQFKELFMPETAAHNPAMLVEHVLTQPFSFVLYIVGFIALWFHLTHGFWSSFHTLGWNNKVWMKRLKVIGNVISTLMCLAFVVVAIMIFTGNANLLG